VETVLETGGKYKIELKEIGCQEYGKDSWAQDRG
jgi:hypothetical protein